jgi:hypothetical protein
MKKCLYSLAALSMLALGACTKKLDQVPPSSLTTENFFTNTNDFTQAVNGVYNRLRAVPTQALWMREVRSDNVVPTSDGNRDWQGIADFSPNITSAGFVTSTWTNNFNGIFNANVTLDALETKGANISDPSLRTRFTAECRFLRAFYYFDLLRYYGKLPVIEHPLSVQEVSSVPRSPVADVYNLIISDLQYAADNLPASYAGAETGRANKWAAKGLLGLVYMTRSGPTYGIEGPGLALNEWDKAAALFNEIIASNQYQFLASFPSIFSYTNENNKDVIFDVQFMTTNNGAEHPAQLVPPAYWTGLGLSGYDNGFGTGTYNVSKSLLQSFRNIPGPAPDNRDTFSIRRSFAPTNGSAVLDSSRPFIKKYIDVNRRGTGRADWPINFIVLRYTDVLLMKAECILHGFGGTNAEALAIVNQVRTRANVPLLSGTLTMDQLLEERRKEFLGEGIRWNDLVREGLAVTQMNSWRAAEGVATIQEVKPEFIIYPVPQQEILAKPGLYVQNPGYY